MKIIIKIKALIVRDRKKEESFLDLVLDAPLVRYSSASMSIIYLAILYRRVS